MTVETTSNNIEYDGNDSTTVFPFNFPFFNDSEIFVSIFDSNGVETPLTQDIDYTLPPGEKRNGGQINYPISGSPLPTTYTLTIVRELPLTQTASIRNQGRFNASVHETVFDKLIMILQQYLNKALNRFGGNNKMLQDIDMNNHRILNLPVPGGDKEPLRKGDITSNLTGATVQYVDDSIKNGRHTTTFDTLSEVLSSTDNSRIYYSGANSAIVRVGDRDNALFDVVLKSTLTPPFLGFYEIELPEFPDLALKLKQGNVVNLDAYGFDTGAEQAAVDYLEGLLFPGGRIVAEQPRSFTGVIQGDLISWEGAGGKVTEFTNSVAGSTMIDLNYVGVSDVDKRNFIQFKDIRFNDEASGTGIGIHSNLFFFIDLSRCFFSGFKTKYGADIEEALWVQLNNVNTDSSNIRLRSLLDPHFNNVIEINGGEFRNPTTFALEVDTCDILRFNGLTVEGDLSNTTTPTRPVSIANANMVTGRLYMEFLRTGDSGIKMDNVKFSSLDHSLLNTNNDSVPALWLHDCANITIDKSKFAGGLKTTGDIANVTVRSCGVRGLMDILPDHDVVFEDCSPLDTAGAIPVDPELQSEMFSGAGIPMKNWYLSSSFAERDPTLDTSGTATMSYDQTQGYHDLNSLKVVATGAQTCVFSNMGTTDNNNDGAIISFMAKSNINTQVNVQGSIGATLGTAFCKFTTEWKRYFVFTQLSVAAAGAAINAIFTTTESCEFNIDDIQTLAYQSYEESGTLFSNFRHVPTHGARITVKEQRNIETRKLNFDQGINLRKTAIAPVSPVEGDVQLANGTTWNPASLSVGAYLVWWQGGAWVALNKGASGAPIS
jgi:hypothetical protein